MRKLHCFGLALALVPGCLLIQPLDDAKSDASGKGGAGSLAGSGNAGRAATPGGGSPSGGAMARAGAPNGGAPNTVDFSFFTGVWTLTSGSIISNCDGTVMTTAVTPGGQEIFAPGTTSDLVLDPASECPLLADVNDRVATGQAEQSCSYIDSSNGHYVDVFVVSYDFTVAGNGRTATALLVNSITLTDPISGDSQTCDTDQTLYYKR